MRAIRSSAGKQINTVQYVRNKRYCIKSLPKRAKALFWCTIKYGDQYMSVYARDRECDRTSEGVRINNRNYISNLQVNREKYRKRTTIFDIFNFYWPDFSSRYATRITKKAVKYNVEPMLACGTREL